MHLQYGEVRQAHFLERPNRFIAHVELEGETVVCHVKNTGRCRELLVRGATVYLERGTNPARRTAWDLIAVEKGHRLINMDAQAPNRIFAQWIRQQEPEITVHQEYRYGGTALGGGEGRNAGAGGPLPVPGRPHGAWCPASA